MSDTSKVQRQHLLRQFSGLGGGGELPWSECVEQPRHFQAHFRRAGRAGEAAQDAAGHRGADDEGEMVSEVAVVLRDEAAVLEAGVQLHCEVLGEDERLGGKVKSGG